MSLSNICELERKDGSRYHVIQDILPNHSDDSIDSESSLLSLVPELEPELDTSVDRVVVLAPGFPGNATLLGYQLAEHVPIEHNQRQVVAVVGYSGISPDILGIGLDEETRKKLTLPEGDFSFDKMGPSIDASLDHLSQKYKDAEVQLVGHSFGGTKVLEHLDDDRLAKVVLVNPVGDTREVYNSIMYSSAPFDYRELVSDAIQSGRVKGDLSRLLTELNDMDLSLKWFENVGSGVSVSILRSTNDGALGKNHYQEIKKMLDLSRIGVDYKEAVGADHDFSVHKHKFLSFIYNQLYKSG